MRAAGFQAYVWTVNEKTDLELILAQEVDGIISDRTDLLRDTLVSRGQWDSPAT